VAFFVGEKAVAIVRKKRPTPINEGFPANVDTERFVPGAVFQNDGVFPAVAAALTLKDFILEKHQIIFRRMYNLNATSEHIDRMTVYEELGKHAEAKNCGGLSYLASLDEGLPDTPNLDSYLRILRKKGARRRIMPQAQRLLNRARCRGDALEQIVHAGQDFFRDVAARVSRRIR